MFKAFPFTISYPADNSNPYTVNAVVSQTVFNLPFIVKKFRTVQTNVGIASTYYYIDVRLDCTYDLYTETLYYNNLQSVSNNPNHYGLFDLTRTSLDTYVTAAVVPAFDANNPSSVITLTYTGLTGGTNGSAIPAESASFALLCEGWNL